LPDDLFILADKSGFVNRFFAFFQLLFSRTKKRRSLAEILRSGCAVLRTIHGAGRLPCSGFQMFPALIVPEGLNGLAGKRIERDEVEDGHQADAHIAKVPHRPPAAFPAPIPYKGSARASGPRRDTPHWSGRRTGYR